MKTLLRFFLAARFTALLAILTSGVYLTSTVFAPISVAEAKKKKRKKRKKKKKGKKRKNKARKKKAASKKKAEEPKEEAKEDNPLARTGAASFKIETTLDKKKFDKSARADAKRDEAIEELKKLIPKAPKSRKAEMIFRLAELYWQKSKFNYGLEMRRLEKSYTTWIDSGRKGKEPTQKDFTRLSELIKQNALKLYEKVLSEYPRYRRNDEVLFYLGYNEYEAGNKNKAVKHYWTLIKQFPKSRLVPDSYLQLGEHFFSANAVGKARKALERALATKSEKIYNYALYKLSWCDYNVQEYAAGIKKLKEVIVRSERLRAGKGVQLKSEALGDLARFFSYVDEVETAFAYFKKKGGEDIALRYSTKLGELFHKQGKWGLEIQTYKMLNKKYPMSPKAPALQARIVSAYSKLNKKDEVRKEVERLVDLYRPNTPWYKAQERNKDEAALEYAFDLTESHLRDLVTEYHRDAQKRKDVPTYELARDIYKKYLEAFRASDSAYQMNFFYGEVLWALKEWKNAAVEYDRVARWQEKEGKRRRFARTSAYNAILAWEKIVAEGEKGKLNRSIRIIEKKKKGKVTRNTRIKIAKLEQNKSYVEEPVPEIELKLSAACDLYFNIADPKDKDLPAIKFKAAFIYYKHNQFVEAAKRYFEMIERWPGTNLSRKSANLILDSLNVKKKWNELEKYARAFRGNKKLVGKNKKFKEQVQALVEGASFKSILNADKAALAIADTVAQRDGRAQSATRFRGFHSEFPTSIYAETALFNALLIYDKADELDNAIEASELLLRSDPKTTKKSKKKRRKRRKQRAKKKKAKKGAKEKPDLKKRTAFLLAGFYERIANFTKAAKLYEKFYNKYPTAKRASDSLFNADVYNQGIGRSDKAVELFRKYVAEFRSAKDAADVYWRICEIFDAEKDAKKSTVCWSKFRENYKKAPKEKKFESRYRLALAYEKLQKKKKALSEYKYILKAYPKLDKKAQEDDGARLAGAHAAFVMLEPEFSKFKKMKVTLKKKVLERKVKAAESLASSGDKGAKPGKYLRILGYKNGDYGIAALTRMGEVFRDMANSIRNAPVPRRLSEDQKDIYRAELDNYALGPEEKALEAFENALDKAYELNIYNDWTLLAQDNLKELNPNKFPDPQKIGYRGAEGSFFGELASVEDSDAANDNETEEEDTPAEDASATDTGASGAAS